jgi:hypothetical protein
VPSELILGDIQRAVENTQQIDVSVVLDQISDAVMAVEKDSQVPA